MDGGSRYALPRWPGSARDRPASGDSRANGVSLARVRHSLPPGAPFQSTSSGPREWRGSVNETRKKDLLDLLQRCQNFEKKALGWSTEAATYYRGDTRQAEEEFERVVERAESPAEALGALAWTWHYLTEPGRAWLANERGLRLDPNYPRLLTNRTVGMRDYFGHITDSV